MFKFIKIRKDTLEIKRAIIASEKPPKIVRFMSQHYVFSNNSRNTKHRQFHWLIQIVVILNFVKIVKKKKKEKDRQENQNPKVVTFHAVRNLEGLPIFFKLIRNVNTFLATVPFLCSRYHPKTTRVLLFSWGGYQKGNWFEVGR